MIIDLEKELINQMKVQIEWLEEASVEQILRGAIEIRRHQTLSQGKWLTIKYSLVLASGGPDIEVDTNGTMVATWTPIRKTTWVGEKALKKLQEIAETLDQIGGNCND